MKITPRHYQVEAKHCILKEWQEVNSTLLVLPTGAGKTIVFADIIQHMQPARAMVIAHREELIWQARDKIERTTGLRCEIEMAELEASTSDLFHRCPVVISTVQTQNAKLGDQKRMGRFKPEDFGLLIIDECHHGVAQTYKNLIHYYTQNPNLRVLGVTATPDRADEEALGQVFKTVAYDYEILDAIHDGWLVDIEQQMVFIEGLDFSAIRTTAGDLNGADLAAVMEAERNLLGVADATMGIIGTRRGLVFTASVKQAEVLCDIFKRRGIAAAWVCGDTPKDERRQMLGDFAEGKIQLVCNCAVLTEGFDDPGVEVVVMARPTKSRALYAQMCGRCDRPLPGIVETLATAEERRAAIAASNKKTCLIIDFVGNAGKHKLMTTADILGGKVSDRAIERAIARAKKLGKPVRMAEELDRAEEELRIEKAKAEDRLRRLSVVAKAKYRTQTISPFDAFGIIPDRERGWDHGRSLSLKQRAVLIRQGVNPDEMPYGQARQLLNELFRRWDKKLCSLKQAQLLRRLGHPTNISYKDASRVISSLRPRSERRHMPADDSWENAIPADQFKGQT